jgi:hypothetical protein
VRVLRRAVAGAKQRIAIIGMSQWLDFAQSGMHESFQDVQLTSPPCFLQSAWMPLSAS